MGAATGRRRARISKCGRARRRSHRLSLRGVPDARPPTRDPSNAQHGAPGDAAKGSSSRPRPCVSRCTTPPNVVEAVKYGLTQHKDYKPDGATAGRHRSGCCEGLIEPPATVRLPVHNAAKCGGGREIRPHAAQGLQTRWRNRWPPLLTVVSRCLHAPLAADRAEVFTRAFRLSSTGSSSGYARSARSAWTGLLIFGKGATRANAPHLHRPLQPPAAPPGARARGARPATRADCVPARGRGSRAV